MSWVSWTEPPASIAQPVLRQAITSLWSPKMDRAWVAIDRAAGRIHLEMVREHPRWNRINEHTPGACLTTLAVRGRGWRVAAVLAVEFAGLSCGALLMIHGIVRMLIIAVNGMVRCGFFGITWYMTG